MPSYAFIAAYQKYHNDWQITSELDVAVLLYCCRSVSSMNSAKWGYLSHHIRAQMETYKHIIKTLNKGWRSMHKNSQLLIASVAEPSRWLGLFWKHQIGTFQYIYDLLHKLPGAHTHTKSFFLLCYMVMLSSRWFFWQHSAICLLFPQWTWNWFAALLLDFFNSIKLAVLRKLLWNCILLRCS